MRAPANYRLMLRRRSGSGRPSWPDPERLTIWLELNGELRQHSSTGAMTVVIAELIAIASSVYTLYPGDVLLTISPEGVSAPSPETASGQGVTVSGDDGQSWAG